jgi:hypothetical protein
MARALGAEQTLGGAGGDGGGGGATRREGRVELRAYLRSASNGGKGSAADGGRRVS